MHGKQADLFRANINVHPMAIWTILEVFRDKSLLARVRAELQAANLTGMKLRDKTEQLSSLPLLQSIYAEVLRLRVELQSVFYSEHEEIQINQWRFPRKSVILAPIGPAHRDANFWNTRDGAKPLDTFWADRFLVYPNDPQSGPQKKRPSGGFSNRLPDHPDRAEPKFVGSGLANSYMPFGVGERVCPGRFFAKREILGFCAMMVNEFDIELQREEEDFQLDPAFYGLGTQRPLQKVPFRIRRRKNENE